MCASEHRGVACANDDIAIGSTSACIAAAQMCSRRPCTGALIHAHPRQLSPSSGRAGADKGVWLDTDGLSVEDLTAVLRHECSIQSPLDAQQVAEDQADGWGTIWAVNTTDDGTISRLQTCGDWIEARLRATHL